MTIIRKWFIAVFVTAIVFTALGCETPADGGGGPPPDNNGKKPGAAVSAPTLASKTDTSVVINAVAAPDNGQTVEYAISTSTVAPESGWQDGLSFSGLTAATVYCVLARSRANDAYNSGSPSAGLLVTTNTAGDTDGKSPGADVDMPTLASKTDTSITINAVAAPGNGQTVEYAINMSVVAPVSGWQDGLSFSGLTAETIYCVFARSKENNAYHAGTPSAGLLEVTNTADSRQQEKSPGAAVDKPTLASRTDTNITIAPVAAPGNGQTVEYIMGTSTVVPDNGWQDGLVFSGLTAETTYYVFARSKANDAYNAGAPSEGLEVKTDTAGSGGKSPGAAVSAPKLASKTDTSITIQVVAVAGNGQTVEYAISTSNSAPASGWQEGLTFSNLNAATAYYIFARSKENNTHNAGTPSAGLSVTTNVSVITYTVTIAPGIQNGAITANPTSGPAGTSITLTISPDPGYWLKNNSLSVKRQDNQNNVPVSTGNTRTFTLPAANVTVSGEFELIPQNTVQVRFDGFGNEDIDLTKNAGNNISRSQVLTVTVNGSYDSYDWYFLGNSYHWSPEDWWGEGKSLIIYFDDYSVGIYTITAVVTKNDVPYSKELTFRLVY